MPVMTCVRDKEQGHLLYLFFFSRMKLLVVPAISDSDYDSKVLETVVMRKGFSSEVFGSLE